MSGLVHAQLTAVWQALAGVSLAALTAALALHAGKLAAEARAWHGIVSHAHRGAAVRFGTTFGAFLGSIGANAVLPARVGETFRIGVVKRRVPEASAVTITATIVLETAIEVAFGAAVVAAAVLAGRSLAPATPFPALVGRAAVPVVLGAALAGAGAFSLAARTRVRRLLARMAAGFAILRSPRAFVGRVLTWKLVAWSLRLASVYAFLVAFHVPAAPWTAVVVVAAQNVAASVPLLPGNAGAQQAAIGLALAGSASAAALLGFGIGMQAATSVVDLVLGAGAAALVTTRGDLLDALAAVGLRRAASART